MGVDKFEDLECWKEARKLVQQVYIITAEMPFSKDFGLRDQLRRAVVSVMANIAEGFGAFSDAEFSRFLGIAARSATESQSHLYVAMDLGYIQPADFDRCYSQVQSCINLCKGLRKYLHAE